MCVFITAGPSTNSVCVFITAVPIIVCVFITVVCVCLLLQDLVQSLLACVFISGPNWCSFQRSDMVCVCGLTGMCVCRVWR